jgi:hypothetical protein
MQNKDMPIGENIKNDMRYAHVKCHEFTKHGHTNIFHLFLYFQKFVQYYIMIHEDM